MINKNFADGGKKNLLKWANALVDARENWMKVATASDPQSTFMIGLDQRTNAQILSQELLGDLCCYDNDDPNCVGTVLRPCPTCFAALNQADTRPTPLMSPAQATQMPPDQLIATALALTICREEALAELAAQRDFMAYADQVSLKIADKIRNHAETHCMLPERFSLTDQQMTQRMQDAAREALFHEGVGQNSIKYLNHLINNPEALASGLEQAQSLQILHEKPELIVAEDKCTDDHSDGVSTRVFADPGQTGPKTLIH